MTDTTAVLVTVYLGLIESEDDAQLGHWDPAHHVRCHRLLAAEVRALRAERDSAMSYFLDPNDPGSLPKYTADYGPTLLNQIQGLAGYYEEMMDDLAAEVRLLRSVLAKAKEMWDAEMLIEDALNEEVHRLMLRVTDLETKCDRCGLKIAHDPPPGITVTQSEVTFTPGEVVYIPATVRYYPSETPGEPDVKEITYP